MPSSTAGLLQNPHAPFDKSLQQREFDADSYCSPVADDSGVASDVSGSIGAWVHAVFWGCLCTGFDVCSP